MAETPAVAEMFTDRYGNEHQDNPFHITEIKICFYRHNLFGALIYISYNNV